jgi:hypothetical protein
MNLDLVVSVDSCVAHLAGALDVPVWVLLPFNSDWRWLDRDDSVWYRRARLFRQSRWGDWDDVFSRVAAALRQETLRPLLQRPHVPFDLADLVERAVQEESSNGRPSPSAAVLQQSGLLDRPEVALLSSRLRAAHQALAQFNRDMLSVAAGPDGQARALTLLQRYAHAQKQREDALADFSAWLAGISAQPDAAPG